MIYVPNCMEWVTREEGLAVKTDSVAERSRCSPEIWFPTFIAWSWSWEGSLHPGTAFSSLFASRWGHVFSPIRSLPNRKRTEVMCATSGLGFSTLCFYWLEAENSVLLPDGEATRGMNTRLLNHSVKKRYLPIGLLLYR